jgi:hypothetical protein
LVRDFLGHLSDGESEFDRRKRLQAEVLSTVRKFQAGDRLPREQVHDRNDVR